MLRPAAFRSVGTALLGLIAAASPACGAGEDASGPGATTMAPGAGGASTSSSAPAGGAGGTAGHGGATSTADASVPPDAGDASAGPAPLASLPPGYPGVELPAVGATTLRLLSPTVLELERITTKDADPAPATAWDLGGKLPAPATFAVTVGGKPASVSAVSFKRRVLYASFRGYDLRIGNWLYLVLDAPISDLAKVSVEDTTGTLWQAPTPFVATLDPRRYGPAIHVNQTGYEPALPKRAMVGYYLGDLGELPTSSTPFSLVDAATGGEVWKGTLASRLDAGFGFQPAQYQSVLEADFSAFTTPGEYQLVVPGLGASYPFVVEDGAAMAVTRAYAQGLYNQRCGVAKELPYTKFTDGADHVAKAEVPTTDAKFSATNQAIAANASVPKGESAPKLDGVGASLYPFVNQGEVDVAGGHHDAGDYSKYTTSSAREVHTLVFAADAFEGVGTLDNLGLPESGDGRSDVLQEAVWEADFLVKLQDADGGFYERVYPRGRSYEADVLPSHGDPQVVWPKTTLVTAAAVGALAEAGSSPRMTTEAVTWNLTAGFATVAALAAQTQDAAGAFVPAGGDLAAPASGNAVGKPITATLDGKGVDLTRARVTWEARDQEPVIGGTSFTFTPKHGGPQWVDAEALLPDGRRVVATLEALFAVEHVAPDDTIEAFNPGVDLKASPKVVVWYPLDADFADGHGGYGPLVAEGNAAIDGQTFAWANRPGGAALRVRDLGDRAKVTLSPPAFSAAGGLAIEAMIYVNAFRGYGKDNASLLDLSRNWDAFLGLHEDKWTGPVVIGAGGLTWNGAPLRKAISLQAWHHLRIALDAAGYTVSIDGVVVTTVASAALAKWSAAPVTLTVGDFDGWIDEVVVKTSP